MVGRLYMDRSLMTYNIPSMGNYVLNTPSTNATWTAVSGSSNDSWVINSSAMTAPNSATIKLSGEDADIDINGMSLKETLLGIQERLALLEPNPALEKEFEELKALGDAYRKMEQDLKERMKTFDILKKE